MTEEHRFSIVTPTQVAWPDSLRIPLSRFRLFVAADTSHSSVEEISAFAEGALIAGMVYFCAWGPGCERFHDIVDEIIADDRVSGRNRFLPPTSDDVVMTTWHAHETLEEALDYFATWYCADRRLHRG